MSALEEEYLFQLKAAKIALPEREVRFKPPRRWKFDFAYMAHKLAIEIEGGAYINGRHTRGSGFIADCEKYNEAALDGWTVLRFATPHIKSGYALQCTERALSTKVQTE